MNSVNSHPEGIVYQFGLGEGGGDGGEWDHSCSSEAGLCLKCEVFFFFFFSFPR